MSLIALFSFLWHQTWSSDTQILNPNQLRLQLRCCSYLDQEMHLYHLVILGLFMIHQVSRSGKNVVGKHIVRNWELFLICTVSFTFQQALVQLATNLNLTKSNSASRARVSEQKKLAPITIVGLIQVRHQPAVILASLIHQCMITTLEVRLPIIWKPTKIGESRFTPSLDTDDLRDIPSRSE